MAESEIVDWFKQRAKENGDGYTSFLGAGAYFHYRPVVIDALVQRGEFLTSYTPYQAEFAQGTLQAIFEFQTMISRTHRHGSGQRVDVRRLDRSRGGRDDGRAASPGRHGAVIARSLHPGISRGARYLRDASGHSADDRLHYTDSGRIDLKALEAAVGDDTACVLIQSPNFFGTIEDIEAIAEIAHKRGALLIVSIAEAVSLGIVEPPRAADIVAMEAQSFGVPLGFGGPYCGVLATKEKFVRQMPGRLAGQTTDKNGKRGFVLTLATREQHIRREKATSNICTNQALVALMVNIFMTVYGKVGLRELAKQNLAKTAYAADAVRQARQSSISRPRRASTSLSSKRAKIPTPSTRDCSATRSSAACRSRSSIPNWAMPRSGAARS